MLHYVASTRAMNSDANVSSPEEAAIPGLPLELSTGTKSQDSGAGHAAPIPGRARWTNSFKVDGFPR